MGSSLILWICECLTSENMVCSWWKLNCQYLPKQDPEEHKNKEDLNRSDRKISIFKVKKKWLWERLIGKED